MPHVTTSPEYNNRLVYQGNQLENSSPSLGNSYHNASSMGYYNYPTANVQQSYPGEYQSANNGVHMSVGDQRCGTVDDRASNNFLNLSTSRNPFPNATSSSHEYYSLQNMDNREAYPCQHSVSQGQVNARRVCRSPSVESSAVRKTTSWTDAMFASMDRVGGTILDLVSEDAMEFERIAATIKQVDFIIFCEPRDPSIRPPLIDLVFLITMRIFDTSRSKQTCRFRVLLEPLALLQLLQFKPPSLIKLTTRDSIWSS